MQTDKYSVFPGTDQSTLLEQATSAAAQVKDKISELSHAAAATFAGGCNSAADKLESAASALHDKADSATGIAHSTANKLTSTATYLREQNLKTMMKDAERVVRKNPGASLLIAAAVGFVMVRAFSKSDS